MRTLLMAAGSAILARGFVGPDADAAAITILDIGDSGVAPDGTIFVADPNPTSPSTGTGLFQPFFRVGAGGGSLLYGDGRQLGFNTDANHPQLNFDTKDGSSWTRAVLFSELQIVNGFYVLSLDANQTGQSTSLKNGITITNMEIFIAPGLSDPETSNTGIVGTQNHNGTGYSGVVFDGSSVGDTLLGHSPVWSLDSAANGDVDVVLQASICDSNGQCGSGHGDLDVFIPVALLSGRPTDNFVLYTEYGGCIAGGASPCPGANGGFEEWRFAPVPAPAALILFGTGLAGLGPWARKRLRGMRA